MADSSGVAVVMTIHQPSDEIFRVSCVCEERGELYGNAQSRFNIRPERF